MTQAQWHEVMGTNPSRFTGDPQRPVEQVSWEEVQAFIRKLNEKEGGTKYRLPTEAEWEYAARAGSTTAYSFGDNPKQLDKCAWYRANFDSKTHPVGQLEPNAWRLYDMHGNVLEWVQDSYGAYATAVADAPVVDPIGPATGEFRVLRGGCWFYAGGDVRSAQRYALVPGNRSVSAGFRLAGGQASSR